MSHFTASIDFLDTAVRRVADRQAPFLEAPTLRAFDGRLNLSFRIHSGRLERWLGDQRKMGWAARAFISRVVPRRWSIDVQRVRYDRPSQTLTLAYHFTQDSDAGLRTLRTLQHQFTHGRLFELAPGVALTDTDITIKLHEVADGTLAEQGLDVTDVQLAESERQALAAPFTLRPPHTTPPSEPQATSAIHTDTPTTETEMGHANLHVDRDAIRTLSERFGIEWLEGEGIDLRKGDTEAHINLNADGAVQLKNLGLTLTVHSITVGRDGLRVDVSPGA